MNKRVYKGIISFVKAASQYFLTHVVENPTDDDFYKSISMIGEFSNDIEEIVLGYTYSDDKVVIKNGEYANARLKKGNYESIFTMSQSGMTEYSIVVLYDKDRTANTMGKYQSLSDIITKSDIEIHKRYTGETPGIEKITTKITMDEKFVMLFPGSDMTETIQILNSKKKEKKKK